MEIARENGKDNLVKLLSKPGCFAEMGLKPPLRPPTPTYISVVLFIFLYLGGVTMSIVFNVGYLPRPAQAVYLSLFLLSVIFYLAVCFKNPGYLDTGSKLSLY